MRQLLNIVIFCCGSFLCAQTSLDTIQVRESAVRQSLGSQHQNWKTKELISYSGQSIAEVLQNEGNVFIKSYGLGSLATSSIRGGSAGHTLVLWNDLPLPTPTLGLLDLALLPLHSVESLALERGGNTALWGSGAIGGVVSMRNEADFSERFQLQLNSKLGSFGHAQQYLKLGLGNAKFQSITKFSDIRATNDFYYQIRPDLPPIQQSNARVEQQNIFQDLYWQPKSSQQLSLHLWQQFADRQIPPTTVQTRSTARQTDQATRLVLNWRQNFQKGIWRSKIGYFREEQEYFDQRTSLNAFSTFIAETNVHWAMSASHRFVVGATHLHTQASTTNYQTGRSENRTALFASYTWQHALWQSQLSLRQSLIDEVFIPLVPIWSLVYRPRLNFEIKTKISRNYRLPTLNDRYWEPGGNPDLLPESGWSQEGSIAWQQQAYSIALTAFNRNISNWILWSRLDGQTFWSSNNIAKVWSRGLETRLTWQHKFLKFEAGYDWIRSTNQLALEAPRIAKGQQLYYTPQHQAFGHIQFQHKNFQASYRHSYTGASEGINEDLEAYQLGEFSLQKSNLKFPNGRMKSSLHSSSSPRKEREHALQFFFRLHNVWNSSYFVIERRAMPGRHFSLGINWDYNSKAGISKN